MIGSTANIFNETREFHKHRQNKYWVSYNKVTNPGIDITIIFRSLQATHIKNNFLK